MSEPAPAKPAQPSKPFSLPVRVTVEQFAVARAEVGAPVIGKDAALSLAGRADISSLEAGTAALTAHRLPVPAGGPAQPGDYALTAQVTPQRIDAKLSVQEPPNGLIATLASLPDIGPLAIDAAVTGPRSALATQLRLSAGPLTATANGTIDLQDSKLGLDLMARAPAMQPAPNVSWQAVALNAHVAGPFATPDATGNLRLDDVKAAGAAIPHPSGRPFRQQGQGGPAGHARRGCAFLARSPDCWSPRPLSSPSRRGSTNRAGLPPSPFRTR